jgi:hypothetical protein
MSLESTARRGRALRVGVADRFGAHHQQRPNIHTASGIPIGIYRQKFGISRQNPAYPLESTVTVLISESNNLRIDRAVDSKLRRLGPAVTVLSHG